MNLTAPLLLLLLTACMVSSARLPRALWQFGKMIRCVQRGVNPLKYNRYGCWCGFGGRGTPVDDVDVCCKLHDKCYEESRKAPGCTSAYDSPYINIYHHRCSNEQVICTDSNDKCEAAVCECDRAAAHCFAQATYNPDNWLLDRNDVCDN